VHVKCSGIKFGSIVKASKSFACRGCSDQPASRVRTSVDIGDGVLVDKFCY